MKKSVIIIPIILGIVGIGIAIGIVYLPPISHMTEPHYRLECLQHDLELIPHMKMNCYYFTQKGQI
ncbi:MAG: hypothetical protein ACREA3_07635 [Nitrosotalea sp.]